MKLNSLKFFLEKLFNRQRGKFENVVMAIFYYVLLLAVSGIAVFPLMLDYSAHYYWHQQSVSSDEFYQRIESVLGLLFCFFLLLRFGLVIRLFKPKIVDIDWDIIIVAVIILTAQLAVLPYTQLKF